MINNATTFKSDVTHITTSEVPYFEAILSLVCKWEHWKARFDDLKY